MINGIFPRSKIQRFISKKIKTNLDQEQVLELVAANKVPENLLVELLVAAKIFP